jgi:hypothetical protein
VLGNVWHLSPKNVYLTVIGEGQNDGEVLD